MISTEEWEIIRLSLLVATVAIAVTLPFGMMVAYSLARDRMPLRFLVENVIQLPLVLPPVVTGFLLLILLGPEAALGRWIEQLTGRTLAFTWFGAAIAAGVVAFPLLVQTMRVAFEEIDPEWEEAGYVYGGTRWKVFLHVTWPLAARGVIAGIVLAFGRALGEFGATIVLAGNIPGQTRTVPLAIFTRINQIGGETASMRLVLISIGLSVMSLLIHWILTHRLHHPHRQ